MAPDFFKAQIRLLQEKFPGKFDARAVKHIQRHMKGMQGPWFKETVQSVIQSGNADYCFRMAAEVERKRILRGGVDV